LELKIELDPDEILIPSSVRITSVEFLDKYIVFNNDDGSYIVLSGKEMRLFNEIIGLKVKDAMSILGGEDFILLLRKLLFYNFFSKLKDYAPPPTPEVFPVNVILTRRCNLRCIHCFLNKSPKKELSPDQWIDFFSKLNEIVQRKYGKSIYIALSGGEPLLYKQLDKLIQEIKREMSNVKIGLFTNGTLINEDMVKVLAKYVDDIYVSLDGVSKEIHEFIRGEGTYDKVLNTIKMLLETDANVIINVTAMPYNIDDLVNNLPEFIVKLRNQYGRAPVVRIGRVFAEGSAATLKEVVELTKNIRTLLEFYRKLRTLFIKLYRGNVLELRPVVFRSSNCGFGDAITVDSDGNIFPCFLEGIHIGKIDDDLEIIIEKLSKLKLQSMVYNMDKCRRCPYRYVCSGGCKIKNYQVNGNIIIPFCDVTRLYDFFFRILIIDDIVFG